MGFMKDPKNEKLMRNKSLTNEEIDVFWKLRKQKEEEHLKHISMLSPRSQANAIEEALRSSGELSDSSLEKLIQKNGWWISSNSAFLNEPPVSGYS
ncbi:hypothetical protein Leryth_003640 [Lithospermum erythrorhizon]|nr:hypothetical protein Leryth_003640 [Lithospermum erythrorhizon]